jgi:Mn-dependent DtxR family transcriptional regulator
VGLAVAQDPIPDDIRRFVLTSIASVPYLEAALLLQREPERSFDSESLARALYIQPRAAQDLLAALHAAGIVRDEGPGWRYAPRDEALASMLQRLQQTYGKHLIEVTTLIHDVTRKNAQRFADAFKLRKDG